MLGNPAARVVEEAGFSLNAKGNCVWSVTDVPEGRLGSGSVHLGKETKHAQVRYALMQSKQS